MRATSKPALARRVQHGVVARALGAEAEIVAHQHIAHAQAAHQHVVDEGLGRLGGQARVEGQHHGLLDAAARQLGQLVAQVPMRAGASSGLFSSAAK
jgi:hypothetical protein